MRIWKLILVFFLFPADWTMATECPVIISGFDDVLRQAENTGLFKAAIKLFEEDQTFTGMPELYTGQSVGPEPAFFLVSAISSWFDSRINGFLTAKRFPSNKRFLRNWLTEWSIEDFKVAKISEIISLAPDRRFIVIFDNSDPSIELAERLPAFFGDKIQSVYLRQVVNKRIPSIATPFYTAFDIALEEHKANRMNAEKVLLILPFSMKKIVICFSHGMRYVRPITVRATRPLTK